MATSFGTLAMLRSAGLFDVAGTFSLSYVDIVHQLAVEMGVDKSVIASKNSLELSIPLVYPRMLAYLDMASATATLGVTPQLVSSVIKDLFVEYLVESSTANHHYAALSKHQT